MEVLGVNLTEQSGRLKHDKRERFQEKQLVTRYNDYRNNRLPFSFGLFRLRNIKNILLKGFLTEV